MDLSHGYVINGLCNINAMIALYSLAYSFNLSTFYIAVIFSGALRLAP